MAFTVTARHSGNSATTSAQTLATNSVTPTASSLLLLGCGVQNNSHAVTQVHQTPSGGGLTYTQVGTQPAQAQWGGIVNYDMCGSFWRAEVGASPSAFAVTVDGYSGTDVGFYAPLTCDITGHNVGSPIVQLQRTAATIGSGGVGSDSGTGSVTLGVTPTAGNLLVVYIDAAGDAVGANASPTAGGGKTMTELHSQSVTLTHAGMWYRVCDGTESATITCSDLGQQVGNYYMAAVEIAAAGGAAAGDGLRSVPWSRGPRRLFMPLPPWFLPVDYTADAVAAGSIQTGAATGEFGFAGPAGGVPVVVGTVVSDLGFVGPAVGVPVKVGVATGSFGFDGPASGVPAKVGAVTQSFGFDGPASGTKLVAGTATGDLGFNAPAIGTIPAAGVVFGTGTGAFGFNGPVAGVPVKVGTVTSSLGFTGPASGVPVIVGTATGSFGFNGPAVGTVVGISLGVATGLFGFSGSASGVKIVTGAVAQSLGFSGAASGTPIVIGQATGLFGFTGPADGTRLGPITGIATGTFGFTGSAAGVTLTPVTGTATGAFGFAAPAVGIKIVSGQISSGLGFSGPAVGGVIAQVLYGTGGAGSGGTPGGQASINGVLGRAGQTLTAQAGPSLLLLEPTQYGAGLYGEDVYGDVVVGGFSMAGSSSTAGTAGSSSGGGQAGRG